MPDSSEVIFRALILSVSLFIILRILKRKPASELSYFELIAAIIIGAISANVIMNEELNIVRGIVGVSVITLVLFILNFLSLKSLKFRHAVAGKGTVFIKDGKIQEDNLKKQKYSVEDLNSLLRSKNVFKTADVEFAILEPTGDLNVFLKKENQPLTPKDLQLKVANEKEPQTVIMDGQIMNDPLAASGKTRQWLNDELEKSGVTLANVFLAQIDSYGELTLDLYDDQVQVPTPQQRPLLNAMLKKCQSDLELYSLSTDSKEAKQMYSKNAKKLSETIDRLSPYLN